MAELSHEPFTTFLVSTRKAKKELLGMYVSKSEGANFG